MENGLAQTETEAVRLVGGTGCWQPRPGPCRVKVNDGDKFQVVTRAHRHVTACDRVRAHWRRAGRCWCRKGLEQVEFEVCVCIRVELPRRHSWNVGLALKASGLEVKMRQSLASAGN